MWARAASRTDVTTPTAAAARKSAAGRPHGCAHSFCCSLYMNIIIYTYQKEYTLLEKYFNYYSVKFQVKMLNSLRVIVYLKKKIISAPNCPILINFFLKFMIFYALYSPLYPVSLSLKLTKIEA